MPRKKNSRKRSGLPSTSSAEPSTSAGPSTVNRESFNDFYSGAAATSSPSYANHRMAELKTSVMAQLEDEHHTTEEYIISVFTKLEKDLSSRAGNTFYSSSTLGEKYPVLEAVGKAIELHGQSEPVSRKVTWNSNNSENMPPPTDVRRLRRSRSVDPLPSHTTILSHRPRLSLSTGRHGLKTPSNNTRPYNFNIATVTPHPQFSQSRNNMTVLRKPNPGETAISMCGSPLLVSGENGSSPSVTVPLADGRVFKVLGRSSPFKEEMRRGLDDETRMKLKQLKEFIGELV